jgi:hypothetical protein
MKRNKSKRKGRSNIPGPIHYYLCNFKIIQKAIYSINVGNDKEVERRYKYYVDYE